MTKDIYFLTLDDALQIHADQVKRYGGKTGLRDQGLLESALSQARMSFGGKHVHKTLHEMAAAYLFHVSKNHPFFDGNKRVGLVCALAFLKLNNQPIIYNPKQVEDLVMNVAGADSGKQAIAQFFLEKKSAM